MEPCTNAGLIEAATPIALAALAIAAPFFTYLLGKLQQRPKDAAAIQTKDAELVVKAQEVERLRAKVDLHEARASSLPQAPVTVNVNEGTPPEPVT